MSSQCWDYADSAISWRQFWTSSRVPLFSRQFLYTKWWGGGGGGGGGCSKELTLYWGLSTVAHHGYRVWEKEYSRKFSLCSKLMVLVATAPLQAGKKKHNCNKEITAQELVYSSRSGPQQRWTAITVMTQTNFANPFVYSHDSDNIIKWWDNLREAGWSGRRQKENPWRVQKTKNCWVSKWSCCCSMDSCEFQGGKAAQRYMPQTKPNQTKNQTHNPTTTTTNTTITNTTNFWSMRLNSNWL